MRKRGNEVEMDERLTEAQAELEALRTSAADAEARAETARLELVSTREAQVAMETHLTEATALRETALEQATTLRSELTELQAKLRESAVRYREARLAASPEVPPELVPESESLTEIDEGFEAAQRVVGHLRERMQEEQQAMRVPAGSPVRRPPDVSSLSAAEKIRLGLEERRS